MTSPDHLKIMLFLLALTGWVISGLILRSRAKNKNIKCYNSLVYLQPNAVIKINYLNSVYFAKILNNYPKTYAIRIKILTHALPPYFKEDIYPYNSPIFTNFAKLNPEYCKNPQKTPILEPHLPPTQ